ncbi:MAG: alpha-hydroxy-acid oxidizing protein [Actinobacteria bacterium]|nr:MAG: alpha-hydroxy-acid oxidizing protein [Actinomycetota bacterium]
MTAPLNVWDYERLAEERLGPGAWSYFAGGADDERTLRWNVEAYGRWQLRPRILCDVARVSTETTVLGTEVALPVLVAPVAFQRVAHPDGEAATARAAASAGTVMCLSTIATATPADVAAAAPGAPRWFQLYVFKDWGLTSALVQQAADAGYSALVLTADTPYLGRREGPLRTGFAIPDDVRIPAVDTARGGGLQPFSLHEHFDLFSPAVSWRDVERLTDLSGLPVVVKGVLTAEDARLACEHGAAAIAVSNHGGRQLDGVPGTLDALPEVVEAVEGRVEVYLDGGIRRGTDVAKALALGARATLAGRAVLWGLAVGGEEGARHVLELLRDEIRLALSLLGCTSPAEIRREHVAPAP